MSDLGIKSGASNDPDTVAALTEIKRAVDQEDASVVLIFLSSKYNREQASSMIRDAFGCPVIACTTSGEISRLGYPEHSISAISIASPRLQVETYFIDELQDFSVEKAQWIGHAIQKELEVLRQERPGTQAFGLLLIDGLSIAEENVAGNLAGALGNIPFIGGSAGDDLAFESTYVFHEGHFVSNAAVLSVFFTDHPFSTFKTQHFVPVVDKKLVITEADTSRRIVYEINGLPAAEEYATLVGVDVEALDPKVFSRYPAMLRIGGDYYVRSIQKVNDDGSLTFFCAIDEGLVLTLARGVDMIENLEAAFNEVEARISPKCILACECILRRLEILERGLQQDASEQMRRHDVVGFHTYGEQYNGLHINQTLTGIAIGE